jgi:hypothetical protein
MEILQRAQKGDKEALPQLRAMFDEKEEHYTESFGNMARLVQRTLIANGTGQNLTAFEGLERKLAKLREELAGPNPTPIERLLAERAAFCWLAVYDYERQYANSGSITIKQADYHQRRIDAAHRRYLSSLKMLATVRKLALPTIQLNLGLNQVNQAVVTD